MKKTLAISGSLCYNMVDSLNQCAGVSESADETDSKSVIRKGVWVQVPPPAPEFPVSGRRVLPEGLPARRIRAAERLMVRTPGAAVPAGSGAVLLP